MTDFLFLFFIFYFFGADVVVLLFQESSLSCLEMFGCLDLLGSAWGLLGSAWVCLCF